MNGDEFGMSTLLYFVLIILAVVSMIASANVNSTFAKYSKVINSQGFTGAEVARMILDRNGLQNVPIERVKGNLTDHYDPTKKVLRLSSSVYDNRSVAALGVAAHECGHAVQDSTGYVPLRTRAALFPAVQLGSNLAIPIFILGLFLTYLSYQFLVVAYAGAILFAFVVAFQLVTLPVEFNASARAIDMLMDYGILSQNEIQPVKKVLSAAAMTYVAAAAVSIVQFLRLLAILGNNSRRR
jgi:Zn-dependent membrane protease YugP